MKGPGARTAYDVRRHWQCPHCGRRAKAEAQVVSRLCFCQPEGCWMRLTDEHKPPRDPFALRDPLSGTGALEDAEAAPPDDVEPQPPQLAATHENGTPPQEALPASTATVESKAAVSPD